jgi:hypothetical protein
MLDCIVKRSELKGRLSSLIDYFLGNERIFERDSLAQKMPQRLKELLKIAVAPHA